MKGNSGAGEIRFVFFVGVWSVFIAMFHFLAYVWRIISALLLTDEHLVSANAEGNGQWGVASHFPENLRQALVFCKQRLLS